MNIYLPPADIDITPLVDYMNIILISLGFFDIYAHLISIISHTQQQQITTGRGINNEGTIRDRDRQQMGINECRMNVMNEVRTWGQTKRNDKRNVKSPKS